MNQPQLDLNAELTAARTAVGARDHTNAVAHLANLVPHVPAHPVVMGVLDELVYTSPDPMQLVPDGPANYGMAAIRAYALGRSGRFGEAYQILRQLAQANPGNAIIDWALPWLEAGALTERQRSEAVTLFLISANQRGFGGRPHLQPDEIAIVRRWLMYLQAVLASKSLDDPLYTAYIPLLRKSGGQDEAMRIVRARYDHAPSYESAVSLAATLRDAKDFVSWYDACQKCLSFQPDDVHTRLDLGDCFWEAQGKLDEAERWYADAVRIQSDEPWAYPSVLAVRYLRTGEKSWRDELEDYAWANPGNDRARVVLGRLTPFFADFIHPADATVNIVNELAAKVEQAVNAEGGSTSDVAGKVTVTTTGLEYPSCRTSIDRQLQLWGGKVEVQRDIRGMQSPDPRQPRAPVHYRIWEYDGQTPRPVVAPPSPEVAQLVEAIAHTRYDLGGWCGYANQVAGRLGVANVPGLLGVMAYPPAPPAGWRMWDWTARVQVAAALVIGHLEPTWEGSTRRQVLLDLANGPADWTTLAAVVALTAAALEQRTIAPEVSRFFTDLYKDLPRPGADWFENTILNCHLRLPGLSQAERNAVRATRAEYEARLVKQILSEAEATAQMFLSRPLPEGVEQTDMGRLVIHAFATKNGRDHPGFKGVLDASLMLTEATVESAEGEMQQYLREQLAVLRLIQKETATEKAEG
jgi:tetratricopeptide (TPR) repeat protein